MKEYSSLLKSQKEFFRKGETRSECFRKEQLQKLYHLISENTAGICEAMQKDLGKSFFESYMTDIGTTLHEIRLLKNNLSKWSRPKKVRTGIVQWPGRSFIYPEPYGTCLIIAPWNYPFQLLFLPLAGAVAAGNTTILKPSEISTHTEQYLCRIISENFPEEYIACIKGGVETSQKLLEEPFDHIFFTGSTKVGKIIMEKAAKNLTPVTLELGGKSPVIIDKTANLKLAAKRICWGKFLNAGQTCIAPDYVFVPESVKDAFINEAIKAIEGFYGKNADKSADYSRIINDANFERLKTYITAGDTIVYGGISDAESRYISPTLLESTPDSAAMKDEIFGPVLPVLSYKEEKEMVSYIQSREKPLAMYIFSENNSFQNKMLKEIQAGNGAINDTIMQFTNPNLPFGGVNHSGIGDYHGKYSFRNFSHYKSIYKGSSLIDIPLRYPPFKDLTKKIIRRLLR